MFVAPEKIKFEYKNYTDSWLQKWHKISENQKFPDEVFLDRYRHAPRYDYLHI